MKRIDGELLLTADDAMQLHDGLNGDTEAKFYFMMKVLLNTPPVHRDEAKRHALLTRLATDLRALVPE